jgi:hypothetical protein
LGGRPGGKAVLVRIPSEERQIQDQRYPVAIDEEQEGEESMDGGFGNDVLVEVLAKVDGVGVVAKTLS